MIYCKTLILKDGAEGRGQIGNCLNALNHCRVNYADFQYFIYMVGGLMIGRLAATCGRLVRPLIYSVIAWAGNK